FRWKSFRSVYAILVILAFLARTYMSAVQSDTAMAIAEDVTLQLFLCFIGISFFMLGMRWRQFSLLFLRIEKHSENAVGDAHPAGVGRRMWLVTVGVFGCALVEHVFDRFTEVMNIMEFGNYTSVQAYLDDTLFERPFWEAALKVFEFISYTYWAVLVAFNDLFTMLCAVYIAMRVANFNSHLAPTLTK
ncbi:Gustatory receptor 33, partial [Frankliniella occidentalis]